MRSCSLLLGMLLACREPAANQTHAGKATDFAPGAPEKGPMEFAPLPPTGVPSSDELADALVAGFPEPDRARVRELLLTTILPWDLRGLGSEPQPRRLVEVEYENLVRRLGGLSPAARLATLELIACERIGHRALGEAMGLAIARYVLDHPGAKLGEGWADLHRSFRALDPSAVTAEAARRLTEIERLERERVGDCREAMRLELLHARLALGSAQTGSFSPAAGSLVDFLRSVGEQPRILNVH